MRLPKSPLPDHHKYVLIPTTSCMKLIIQGRSATVNSSLLMKLILWNPSLCRIYRSPSRTARLKLLTCQSHLKRLSRVHGWNGHLILWRLSGTHLNRWVSLRTILPPTILSNGPGWNELRLLSKDSQISRQDWNQAVGSIQDTRPATLSLSPSELTDSLFNIFGNMGYVSYLCQQPLSQPRNLQILSD